ncbi:hypothetical protein [Streptomyces cellulosae]|uniref:FAD-binding domain-containing protein n=1 Tax=Streptomyces cellulosae TaxID=1968 RepID=A0ABW7YC01_STRCE
MGNAGPAAATLQRAGVRTLLIERHNVPGEAASGSRRRCTSCPESARRGQQHMLRGLFEKLGVADSL